jgi:hypothetical protein
MDRYDARDASIESFCQIMHACARARRHVPKFSDAVWLSCLREHKYDCLISQKKREYDCLVTKHDFELHVPLSCWESYRPAQAGGHICVSHDYAAGLRSILMAVPMKTLTQFRPINVKFCPFWNSGSGEPMPICVFPLVSRIFFWERHNGALC